ncbi:tetratricopeptide repeat protein [Streptomyces sp. NPDC012935]|uniref:tetratricopeptide repeat protein n=1 Tax=Streptomyces sp. NPDC012935 TaxID=3364857 RepID=UPI0036C5AEC9
MNDDRVHNNTFHGPAVVQAGEHGNQNVQFVYQWKPAYRIEDFPTIARPVPARMLAEQPSRLLRAVHQVVPFTGRHRDLDELARWRDDPVERLSIRLVHGPGGQGKTRLAAHFADLSGEAGWTVWQAAVNEAGADPIATSSLPDAGAGILLVADYAERWPAMDLRKLLQEPLVHRTGVPVRILLLARPAGVWWESLDTWIGDTLDAPAELHPLLPLADDPQTRAALFRQARDHFADHLRLPSDQADHIGPPLGVDSDKDYAQILTIHIAALAAVDAHLHNDPAPVSPARASAYLLKRERAHWSALHQRSSQPLSTTPEAMGRTVLTATLTRPLARTHGWAALAQAGLADSTDAANALLDDHRYCYPPPHADPARAVTVLEPLYPDRLGEDFIGLTTPADPNTPGTPHPLPGAITDDWAHQAAERLILGHTNTAAPAPWTRDALTVLIETARRWPHVAIGQLFPLLKKHPELAIQAGGIALATLAGLDTLDITVLEAIEPHLPPDRHTDLDVGIAALTVRLAQHRLATTEDPAEHARTHDELARRQSNAGLRQDAVTAGQTAARSWHTLTRTDPTHKPDLAHSLSNLGTFLSDVGRRQEALTVTKQAVEIRRRLAWVNPAAFEPGLATSLTNLGAQQSKVGRWNEALAVTTEAVKVYRRLAASNPAAHESDLATSLSNLGAFLSVEGQRKEALAPTEEAVEIRRRLAAGNPAAHEPDLAHSLTNLGARLSENGRWEEALISEMEAVEIRRRLAAGNPTAYEPDLAHSLTNLGNRLSEVGRGEEAVAVTREAVEAHRRLAASNPAAHESDLATSLSNLGASLLEVGRGEEAVAVTREAVEAHRRLAASNPAAHEPVLARSLYNLGLILSELGRRDEALAPAEEAVEIRRRLAAGNPAAHAFDLARSLNNFGNFLAGVGRRQEALTVTRQAVEIFRRLAAGNRAAYEPDLATSLINLGSWMREVGRPLEAFTAAREAVEICRPLVADEPAQFLIPLCNGLALQGKLFIDAGWVREASEIQRWLADNDPRPGR